MTIFGKRLSDYLRFCGPFLLLILVVGVTRLILSLAGVPNSTARWVSINAATWAGVFYYSVRVARSRFGSYKQLLVICALQNLVGQAVIIFGIVLTLVTGTTNIFSAPEFAFGNGNVWLHLAAHLTVGPIAGTLMPWIVGSGILAVTRRMAVMEYAR